MLRPDDRIARLLRRAGFAQLGVDAAIEPDEDVEAEGPPREDEVDTGRLSAFQDFVNTLDLDELDDEDE